MTASSSSRATDVYTYAQIVERSNRLAAFLHTQGLGCHTERAELRRPRGRARTCWASTRYNGHEYVEGMLGAWRARVAPFNVNYRYVKNELHYLLATRAPPRCSTTPTFAPRLAEVLPELPQLRVLIQIADDSGNDLLPGAVDYESIVGVRARRSRRRSSRRPTISTSSTPAARPACRRACCGASTTSS